MNRRDFLRHGAALVAVPALSRAADERPQVPCRRAAGDVTSGAAAGQGRAIVWSKCDRPARLVVEYTTRPLPSASSSDLRRIVGPAALEDTDFAARVDLADLPDGQRISYRVRFQD